MEHNWSELLGWNTQQIEDLRFAGYSFVQQGQYHHALKFFEALAILPNPEIYDIQTLGGIYLQIGNNLSALTYLEKALELNPNHEETQLNRVKALFLLGHTQEAFTSANQLQNSNKTTIANQASALILSYQ